MANSVILHVDNLLTSGIRGRGAYPALLKEVRTFSPSTSDYDALSKVKDVFYHHLPGHGEKRNDLCGNFRTVRCVSCGYETVRVYYCDDPTCPVCYYRGWADTRGDDVTVRLKGYREASLRHNGRDPGIVKHIVVSFDVESDLANGFWLALAVTSDEFLGYLDEQGVDRDILYELVNIRESLLKEWANTLMRVAVKVLRFLGIEGCVAILHHVRTKNGVHYGPHVHVFGYGKLDMERVEEVYKRYGVVVHLVTQFWKKSKRLFFSNRVKYWRYVAEHVRYCLTHCFIMKRRHAIRYYGVLSYNKLGCRKEQEKEVVCCPRCGNEMWLCEEDPEIKAVYDRLMEEYKQYRSRLWEKYYAGKWEEILNRRKYVWSEYDFTREEREKLRSYERKIKELESELYVPTEEAYRVVIRTHFFIRKKGKKMVQKGLLSAKGNK